MNIDVSVFSTRSSAIATGSGIGSVASCDGRILFKVLCTILGSYPNVTIATFILSEEVALLSYVMVKQSFSRSMSTVFTPASSNRTAETESGHVSQVTPPLLFIMPSWLCGGFFSGSD